ncbi:MAG: DsrE family protein [Magnetovibrionaceae bacterium]
MTLFSDIGRLMLALILTLGFLVLGGLTHPASAEEEEGLETELAEPEPDWDNPRKVLLQVTTKDPAHVNNVYYNAINIKKFYGDDFVQVAIVFYGPGIRTILKESAIAPERVSSLQTYGVEFIACGNTLETIEKGQEDLLDGVIRVQAGIPEIIERKMKGWHYVVP